MRFWFVGPACGFAVVLVLLGSPRTQAQAPAPVNVDKLWDKIYPVFAHARCANCHGVVQSYPGYIHSVTADTHPGGDVRKPGAPTPVRDCFDCHTSVPSWEVTAPEMMQWAGKPSDEVCAIEALQVDRLNADAGGAEATRKDSYLNHLTEDEIIDSAWGGDAGGARKGPSNLQTPPLEKKVFLAAAADWVNAGAPCRTTGRIAQVESFGGAYSTTFPLGTDGKMVVSTSGRRELLVRRLPDGTAVSAVNASGHDMKIATYTQITPTVVCHVTMTDTTDWTTIGPTSVPSRVTFKVQDGRYEIALVAPDDPATPVPTLTQGGVVSGAGKTLQDQLEAFKALGDLVANRKGDTTRMTSSHRMSNDCGMPAVNDTDDPVDATWPPWEFTIKCPADIPKDSGSIQCDPREPVTKRSMTGQMIRKVFAADDAFEPQSWLILSPIGTGIADLQQFNKDPQQLNTDPQNLDKPPQFPVTVTTTWSLK